MLTWAKARVTRDLTWALNLKWKSQVTPITQGVFSRGSMELLRITRGWLLDCANWGVNRVMVDFGTEISKPRSSARSSIFGEWASDHQLRDGQWASSGIWSTLELEQEIVKSTAYELVRKSSDLGNVETKDVVLRDRYPATKWGKEGCILKHERDKDKVMQIRFMVLIHGFNRSNSNVDCHQKNVYFLFL